MTVTDHRRHRIGHHLVPKVWGILFDAATFPIAQANDSAEMAGVAISHDKRRMTFADGVSKILRT
jgi:hypothetical protein